MYKEHGEVKMDFYAVLDQVLDLLRHRRKVSYKALQLQFNLDADCLAALKEELLYAYSQVVDDDGCGLMWTGEVPPETDVWHGIALGFSDIVTLVTARLQQEKRLTYVALKHIFGLDDAMLEVVRQELIFAKRVAADEHGRVLVWSREPSLSLTIPPRVTSTTDSSAPTTTHGMSAISPIVVLTRPGDWQVVPDRDSTDTDPRGAFASRRRACSRPCSQKSPHCCNTTGELHTAAWRR
jgi:hypothetical protein